MTERRYSEDEVAAIFRKATEDDQPDAAGREPGHDPARVAEHWPGSGHRAGPDRAGCPVARAQRTPHRTNVLGLPIGVARTIELGRRITDEEWDRLVVTLRETFNARGIVSVQGGLRQWTNGNLQALLEPTPTGDRLRLRTTNGNARAFMRIGIATLVAAAAVLFARWTGGSLAQALPGFTILAATGIGAFAAGALRLPGWARLRTRQMEGIGAQFSTATQLEPRKADFQLASGGTWPRGRTSPRDHSIARALAFSLPPTRPPPRTSPPPARSARSAPRCCP